MMVLDGWQSVAGFWLANAVVDATQQPCNQRRQNNPA